MTRDERKKLQGWQERHTNARSKYQNELDEMEEREKLYKGTEQIKTIVCRDFKKKTKHSR